MGRLGIIAGSALRESAFAASGERVVHAGVALTEVDDTIVLQRHGRDEWSPPHRIDHRAHVAALLDAGVDRVLAVSSVGSLRLDWPVGTCAIVDDFYAPAETIAYYDDPRSHTVPVFDAVWRAQVIETWRARTTTPVHDVGVYAQTRGPRFETPAEVRALTGVADLVGMTVASECILATEVGLPLRRGLRGRQPCQRARRRTPHDRGVPSGGRVEPGPTHCRPRRGHPRTRGEERDPRSVSAAGSVRPAPKEQEDEA